jgi:hypothetical protein
MKSKNKEWLEFREKENKPKAKTKIFQVWSKCSEDLLGIIKWYPQWRHYCYFPCKNIYEEEYVYSDRCLVEISKFITKLNTEHKNKTGRTYTELMSAWRNRV